MPILEGGSVFTCIGGLLLCISRSGGKIASTYDLLWFMVYVVSMV